MKSGKCILVLTGFCIVLCTLVAGCTLQQAAPAQTPTAQPTTQITQAGAGIANPALVNFGNLGRKTGIEKDAAGNECGMCTFTNDTSCEEWALFRGEGCKAGGK